MLDHFSKKNESTYLQIRYSVLYFCVSNLIITKKTVSMKTIIREMVETIKQLFAQKQQMQEPIVANCKITGVVAQKTRANLINGVNR